MDTKPLLYGLIGFFIGGLIVSVAATTFEKPEQKSTGTNAHSSTSMDDMAASLTGRQGDAFDHEFINQMIVHHEGAVEMAQLAEGQAKHEEIKQLSRDIISAQQKEIEMMRAWKQSWGYASEDSMIHPAH